MTQSLTKDLSVAVDEVQEEGFAFDHEDVGCAADQARQTRVLNLEIHIKPVQLLALHRAENILHHFKINLAFLVG